MIIASSTTIKNARANATLAAFSGGVLQCWSGAMPVPGAAPAGLKLAEISLPSPAGIVADGVFTLTALTSGLAIANGTISFVRVLDSAAHWLYDLDAGAISSGAAVEIDTPAVLAGGSLQISSFSLTEP